MSETIGRTLEEVRPSMSLVNLSSLQIRSLKGHIDHLLNYASPEFIKTESLAAAALNLQIEYNLRGVVAPLAGNPDQITRRAEAAFGEKGIVAVPEAY